MRAWRVTFSCRRIGALGVSEPRSFDVGGKTADHAVETARAEVASTYEHLHLLDVCELPATQSIAQELEQLWMRCQSIDAPGVPFMSGPRVLANLSPAALGLVAGIADRISDQGASTSRLLWADAYSEAQELAEACKL